jgi:hypothetical protein
MESDIESNAAHSDTAVSNDTDTFHKQSKKANSGNMESKHTEASDTDIDNTELSNLKQSTAGIKKTRFRDVKIETRKSLPVAPPPYVFHFSESIALEDAADQIEKYLEHSRTAPHFHPDATLTAAGVQFNDTSGPTGGAILSNLRRFLAGLKGNWIEPLDEDVDVEAGIGREQDDHVQGDYTEQGGDEPYGVTSQHDRELEDATMGDDMRWKNLDDEVYGPNGKQIVKGSLDDWREKQRQEKEEEQNADTIYDPNMMMDYEDSSTRPSNMPLNGAEINANVDGEMSKTTLAEKSNKSKQDRKAARKAQRKELQKEEHNNESNIDVEMNTKHPEEVLDSEKTTSNQEKKKSNQKPKKRASESEESHKDAHDKYDNAKSSDELVVASHSSKRSKTEDRAMKVARNGIENVKKRAVDGEKINTIHSGIKDGVDSPDKPPDSAQKPKHSKEEKRAAKAARRAMETPEERAARKARSKKKKELKATHAVT